MKYLQYIHICKRLSLCDPSMSLKNLVIDLFPSLYIKKHFAVLKGLDFSNYKQRNLEPELLLIPFLIERDENFIDVGANRGYYMFAAAECVGPAKVIAFEPNPHLSKKLKAVFKKSAVIAKALSSTKGKAILNVPFTDSQPDDSLGSVSDTRKKDNAFNFEVELDTLNDVSLEQKITKIGLIKIDVEGNEMKVLEGSTSLIVRDRPNLIVEIESRHHNAPLKDLIADVCIHFNYAAYYFSPADNRILPYQESKFTFQNLSDLGTFRYINNFIFIASEKDPELIITRINSKIEGKGK